MVCDGSMLRQDVTENEIKIYELYLQRVLKEYDLNWTRFKIYFGFNSGVLVAVGFIVKPYIYPTLPSIPDQILWATILLSLIGIMFSFAWLLVNIDGRKWQNFMNKLLEDVEDSLFENSGCALYKQINMTYSNYKYKIDVVDINLYIVGVFFIIWLSLGFLSVRAILY